MKESLKRISISTIKNLLKLGIVTQLNHHSEIQDEHYNLIALNFSIFGNRQTAIYEGLSSGKFYLVVYYQH